MSERISSWLEKGLTARARLLVDPAVQRDIDEQVLEQKLQRGDLTQRIRLRRYPSIEVDFDTLYAGTYRGSLDELEQKLFEIGYRNNPTAYVEVTDRLGPDDGSYARQIIKEDSEFPHLPVDRPLNMVPLYNRLKLQNHVTTFVDEDRVHILAHQETSAWIQPGRHLSVSEGDAKIGIREFRQAWDDEFGVSIPKPLSGTN